MILRIIQSCTYLQYAWLSSEFTHIREKAQLLYNIYGKMINVYQRHVANSCVQPLQLTEQTAPAFPIHESSSHQADFRYVSVLAMIFLKIPGPHSTNRSLWIHMLSLFPLWIEILGSLNISYHLHFKDNHTNRHKICWFHLLFVYFSAYIAMKNSEIPLNQTMDEHRS